MRHFSGEFEGVRLLMSDELDLIAGGEGEDTDDVQQPERENLDRCKIGFLSDQLERAGMPNDFLDQVQFVSGLDGTENWITSQAYATGASAVTQGNTVYVRPELFNDFASFRNIAAYEEVFHAAQFAHYGTAGFYAMYGGASAMGWLSGTGTYEGNSYELAAKGFAHRMGQMNHQSGCR